MDAYDEGYRSYETDKSNPYEEGSDNYYEFEDGHWKAYIDTKPELTGEEYNVN